jgi:hypothetical protein
VLKELASLSEEILSWKKTYKNVYYIKIDNSLYIFRTLTRGEYLNLLDIQQYIGEEIIDSILSECLLYPRPTSKELGNILAGNVDYIGKKIIEYSGFSKGEKLIKDIEEERQKISLLDNQIILLICKAFPHLTLESINELDYNTLVKYLVLAEAVLDAKINIEKQPDSQKIDFEQENLMFGEKDPFKQDDNIKRGDVSTR